MKKKTSTRVEPGELVHIGDKVYMASSWDKTRPCSEQCHLHDGVACNGYCFRWDNTEEVVFRFILPDVVVSDDTTVVSTPDLVTAALVGAKMESTARAKMKYYTKKARERIEAEKSAERKRKGGIDDPTGRRKSYVAHITIDGKRYRFASPDRSEAEKWLEDMKKNAEKL